MYTMSNEVEQSWLTEKLHLDNNIRAICTASNDTNLIKDLYKAQSLVDHVNPSIILIDIGSNDLAALIDQNHNTYSVRFLNLRKCYHIH